MESHKKGRGCVEIVEKHMKMSGNVCHLDCMVSIPELGNILLTYFSYLVMLFKFGSVT